MNTTRRRMLLACAGAAGLARAQGDDEAAPAEVAAELPGARLQGRGTLRFIGLRVYDARLWRAEPAVSAAWAGTPFALELQYARDLKGALIAERSLTEMRRQGEIAPETAQRWLHQMKLLFRDVRAGERVTGLHRPGQGARFFYDGRLRGEVPDTELARQFFGIWLSPATSEPALRRALLGADS